MSNSKQRGGMYLGYIKEEKNNSYKIIGMLDLSLMRRVVGVFFRRIRNSS